MTRIAPWTDFAGRSIREGDVIAHPVSGDLGEVIFLEGFAHDPGSAWRVNYGDDHLSRLCLQVGERGRAVVTYPVPTPPES